MAQQSNTNSPAAVPVSTGVHPNNPAICARKFQPYWSALIVVIALAAIAVVGWQMIPRLIEGMEPIT